MILTLGAASVQSSLRAPLVSAARLVPGTTTHTRGARNVAAIPQGQWEDSVMSKPVTANVWKGLKELSVTSVVLDIITSQTADLVTVTLQELTLQLASITGIHTNTFLIYPCL